MMNLKKFNYVNSPKIEELLDETNNSGRKYISPDGKKYPSVTTILGHFKKDKILKWRNRVGEEEANAVSSRASNRGTKFHSLVERYMKNLDKEKILKNIMPDMIQTFYDCLPYLNNIDNIHFQEQTLWDDNLRVAGRCDLIAEYNGVLSVIDFKTSNRIKKEEWIEEYFMQTSIYLLMHYKLTGTLAKQIVIIISVDGEPRPQIFIKNINECYEYAKKAIELIKRYHEKFST